MEVKEVGGSQLFLESNPKEAKKHVYYGNIKYLKKDYEGALKNYLTSLKLSCKSESYYAKSQRKVKTLKLHLKARRR